jgi:chromosome segregation ATPase
MAKFFHINMPADYSEWMELISNSDLYTQRAKELKEYSEAINAALTQYEGHKDVESEMGQARAKHTEAEDERKKAREYAKWKRAEGDKKFDESIAVGAKHLADIEARIKLANERQAKLDAREAKLETESAVLEHKALELQKRQVDADKKAADALQLKAMYEDRYNRIMMAARD